MKLLLDENLPEQLIQDFPEFKIYTVRQMGWKGKTNGALLQLIIDNQFDVLITGDKNLHLQQNFKKYPIPVFVIHTPRINYNQIKPLVPKIMRLLKSDLNPGPYIID